MYLYTPPQGGADIKWGRPQSCAQAFFNKGGPILIPTPFFLGGFWGKDTPPPEGWKVFGGGIPNPFRASGAYLPGLGFFKGFAPPPFTLGDPPRAPRFGAFWCGGVLPGIKSPEIPPHPKFFPLPFKLERVGVFHGFSQDPHSEAPCL